MTVQIETFQGELVKTLIGPEPGLVTGVPCSTGHEVALVNEGGRRSYLVQRVDSNQRALWALHSFEDAGHLVLGCNVTPSGQSIQYRWLQGDIALRSYPVPAEGVALAPERVALLVTVPRTGQTWIFNRDLYRGMSVTWTIGAGSVNSRPLLAGRTEFICPSGIPFAIQSLDWAT